MEAGEVDAVALARETARTIAPQNTLHEMMVDQLAQAHRLTMALMGKSEHFTKFITSSDQKARQQVSSIEAARLAGSAACLMDAFQRGVLALDRLQNGAKQTVVVKHMQNVQVGNGGQAVVTGSAQAKSRKGGGGRRK